ncbi:MAG: CopL family metal-binding regulatory protein [Steroidobacteraceae bacterium]
MRAHSPWRILLFILLAWQMNANVFASTMMASSHHGMHGEAQEPGQMPCHGHDQADEGSSVQPSLSDGDHEQDGAPTKPDCCKSSLCQCQGMHSPALLISLPALAQSLAHPPMRNDLATPRALARASDSFRPPI